MCPLETTIQKRIREALDAREPVIIYENTEAGVRQWSVSLISDLGFWLASFPQCEPAMNYCEEHHLPVRKVASMTHSGMDYDDVFEDIEDDTCSDFLR